MKSRHRHWACWLSTSRKMVSGTRYNIKHTHTILGRRPLGRGADMALGVFGRRAMDSGRFVYTCRPFTFSGFSPIVFPRRSAQTPTARNFCNFKTSPSNILHLQDYYHVARTTVRAVVVSDCPGGPHSVCACSSFESSFLPVEIQHTQCP